jgi:hypothetical protein
MAQSNAGEPARIRPRGSAYTTTTRDRIAGTLRRHFGLRIHTSILLLWSFSAGLLTTKGLLALGMQSMFWRYTLAVLVAYGAFLIGVRIWLAYVGAPAGSGGSGGSGSGSNGGTGRRSAQPSKDRSRSGSIDLPDFSSGRGSGGSVFSGKGGGSGGGGASSSFDGPASPPSNLLALDSASLSTSGGDSGGSSLGGLGDVTKGLGDIGDLGGGDGEGCLIALAVMIVAGLLLAAVGAAFFVISMGPEILIDAAFNALLTGGMIKAGQRMNQPGWIGSVFKATWLPLAIVLVSLWIFAAAAAVLTPQAHSFPEVWRIVWPSLLGAI